MLKRIKECGCEDGVCHPASVMKKGSEAAVTDKDFENEFQYQVTMSLVRRLKENGTVSENEYRQIDEIMLEKYRPVLGTLLSGKPLTRMSVGEG